MPVNYSFKPGVDLPTWQQLRPSPNTSYSGAGVAYDGAQFLYYAVQSSSSGGGTTQLWQYDTYTDSWKYLAGLAAANTGMDLEYDQVRNVLYVTDNNASTSWHYFNLNDTSLTFMGATTAAWALSAAIGTALPAALSSGSSLCMPNDVELSAVLDSGTASAGTTSSVTVAPPAASTSAALVTPTAFPQSLAGCAIKFAAGTTTTALQNKVYVISSVSNPAVTGSNAGGYTLNTATNMAATPVAGDTFTVVLPTGTSTGTNSTTTLNDTAQNWAVNQYANADVVITSGTGSGQRRRITSNTATALTLAAAVTGNPRTGTWTTTPDATSVYQIVPSSDFLYFMPGNGTAMYKMDVVATTLSWTGLTATPLGVGVGGDFVKLANHGPFSFLVVRGNNTSNFYAYNFCTNSYVTLTSFGTAFNVNAGSYTATIFGKKRVWWNQQSQNSGVAFDLTTGKSVACGTLPYATGSTNDGHRAHWVTTPSGVTWLYFLRAGGQELFRLAVGELLT